MNVYNAILYNQNNVLSGTVGTLIKQHKHNDILNFLIILTDEDYINKHIFGGKSLYKKLLNKASLFYGNLDIKKFSEFTNSANNIAHLYLIDGNLIPRIVYIRLPKEKLYVPAEHFQERYLDSKINELCNIFTTLQAESIQMSIIHENSSNIKLSISSGVTIQGIEANIECGKTTDTNKKITTTRHITFEKPDKNTNTNTNTVIDTNTFLNFEKFYYLSKDEGWIDIIRNRVYKKSKDSEYTYNYTENNCFSADLSAQMELLHIKFAYNSSKFENLKIEYKVIYFPFTGDVSLPSQFEQNNNPPLINNPINNVSRVLQNVNPLDIFNPFKWGLFG